MIFSKYQESQACIAKNKPWISTIYFKTHGPRLSLGFQSGNINFRHPNWLWKGSWCRRTVYWNNSDRQLRRNRFSIISRGDSRTRIVDAFPNTCCYMFSNFNLHSNNTLLHFRYQQAIQEGNYSNAGIKWKCLYKFLRKQKISGWVVFWDRICSQFLDEQGFK